MQPRFWVQVVVGGVPILSTVPFPGTFDKGNEDHVMWCTHVCSWLRSLVILYMPLAAFGMSCAMIQETNGKRVAFFGCDA
jgi:hypothetical protein